MNDRFPLDFCFVDNLDLRPENVYAEGVEAGWPSDCSEVVEGDVVTPDPFEGVGE